MPTLPGRRVAVILFNTFYTLALLTPGWRVGPFIWLPLWSVPMLAGRQAQFGLLSVLPALTVIAWFIDRRQQRRHWQWGPWPLTAPLAFLSLFILTSLSPALTWRTVSQVGAVVLAWWVYLFLLNERPSLTLIIAAIIVVQAGVAVAQFVWQSDLGLAAWGELPLDPLVEGVSILHARGRPWLRGYGLTPHPNVLGAMLAVLLVWLLPRWRGSVAPQRHVLAFAMTMGLVGLVVTFSRAAWLGFTVGMVVGLWQWRPYRSGPRRPLWARPALLLLLPATLLLVTYSDLVASRFLSLESPIEARSLRERVEEFQIIAPAILEVRPWRGVGAGNYVTAAANLPGTAVVAHNVTLLILAELGLLGAAVWLWLAGAGSAIGWRSLRAAPWVTLLVITLFDNSLWLTASWRGAMLFAFLLAAVAGGTTPSIRK